MRISRRFTHRRDVRMGGYPLGSLTDSGQRGGVTAFRGIVLAASRACHDQGVHAGRGKRVPLRLTLSSPQQSRLLICVQPILQQPGAGELLYAV